MRLFLVLAMLLLASCAPSAESIARNAIAAHQSLESYDLAFIMQGRTSTVVEGQNVTIVSVIEMSGTFDRGDMHLISSMRSEAGPLYTERSAETYIIGDTMYLKNEGVWYTSRAEEPLDQSADLAALLKGSEVQRLADEDGFHVLRVIPSESALEQYAQLDRSALLEDGQLTSMRVTYWVDAKTFLITRAQTTATFQLQDSEFLFESEARITPTAGQIELPDEALDAVDLSPPLPEV